MIKPQWTKHPEGFIQATYGWSYYAGNSSPHFSITAEIKESLKHKEPHSFGQLHENIRHYFPRLIPLLRWHLADIHGQPVHYIANAKYWHKLANYPGISSIDRPSKHETPEILKERFVDSVVDLGDVETLWSLPDAETLDRALRAREPALLSTMLADMTAANVPMPETVPMLRPLFQLERGTDRYIPLPPDTVYVPKEQVNYMTTKFNYTIKED